MRGIIVLYLFVLNSSILSIDVQDFLKENAQVAPSKVALKKSPFSELTSSELAEQVDSRQRLSSKLPHWLATPQIYYPPRQNAEQCSSEETARYKASLVAGKRAIDLTGGFGVDSWALAQRFSTLDYCEINTALYPIVAHNFRVLGCDNISPHCVNGLDVLQDQDYDLIYLDPARRDVYNRKMVSFSDCVPNVIEHQDMFFDRSRIILLKASPMMDISLAVAELKGVKEVHIVALKNECKELLFLLEKGYDDEPEMHCVNLPDKTVFRFRRSEEQEVDVVYEEPLSYLFEPHVALLKAGAFNSIANRFNLKKLHHSTQLYTADNCPIDFPGKTYKILHVVEYNKKKISKLLTSGKANVKTYNFAHTPEQVKKKLGLKDGGDVFLFGVKIMTDKYKIIIAELLT